MGVDPFTPDDVDPFTPGPSFEELAARAHHGRLMSAPRDLHIDGQTIPAGTLVAAETLQRAGITLAVIV